MNKLFFLIITVCIALQAQPIDEDIDYVFPDDDPLYQLIGWKVALGDSSIWSDSAYNDSHWTEDAGIGLWISEGKNGKGIRWYRKSLFFPEPLDSLKIIALYQVAIVCADEIYWDGYLIARNGEPASDREHEKAGFSGQITPIPSHLTVPGRHVVALRISNIHTLSGMIDAPLQIGYLSEIHEYLFQAQALSLFLAGIFFLTAVFHFALLLGHSNKWPYALFSAFCFSCAVHIFIRGMIRYFQIDLSYYYILALLNDIPWFFMIVLLPIFFLFEFNSLWKKRLTVIILCAGIFVIVFARLVVFGIVPIAWMDLIDKANILTIYFSIGTCIIVSCWAVFHRKKGSLSALIGLLVFLCGVYYSERAHVENGWAIGFAVLNVFLTVSLSRQMAYRNRLHQESELRNARLEIELLKKHIQPHFLLNSLNSIVAWLEEEPRTAATLVNALADELRMLLAFSGKKMISLTEEIALCKAHLQVMSLRQDKQFTLETHGITQDEQLPPLILHTLVENGLTHGYKGKSRGLFTVTHEPMAGGVRLTVFNDSDRDTGNLPPVPEEGTGIRYVRTRLEEAFPGSWTLVSGWVAGGWQVVITWKGVS